MRGFPVKSLLLSLAILVLTESVVVSAWRVDCRKFVFAPKCRGVSAKRASLQTSQTNQLDNESNRDLSASFPESDNGLMERNNNLREIYELSRLQRQVGMEKAIWEKRERLAKVLQAMAEQVGDDAQ